MIESNVPAPSQGQKVDLHDVMKVVDLIRQQERIQSLQKHDANDKNYQDNSNNDPLYQVRKFLSAPGVVEGLATTFLCLGVMLPVRQQILRLGRQRRLGDLPDLIVTPALVLVTLQASLRVASLTGARTYLERVPLMNEDALHHLCHDPILQYLQSKTLSSSGQEDHRSSHSMLWNPEAQAIHALHQAISTCKQKR